MAFLFARECPRSVARWSHSWLLGSACAPKRLQPDGQPQHSPLPLVLQAEEEFSCPESACGANGYLLNAHGGIAPFQGLSQIHVFCGLVGDFVLAFGPMDSTMSCVDDLHSIVSLVHYLNVEMM